MRYGQDLNFKRKPLINFHEIGWALNLNHGTIGWMVERYLEDAGIKKVIHLGPNNNLRDQRYKDYNND